MQVRSCIYIAKVAVKGFSPHTYFCSLVACPGFVKACLAYAYHLPKRKLHLAWDANGILKKASLIFFLIVTQWWSACKTIFVTFLKKPYCKFEAFFGIEKISLDFGKKGCSIFSLEMTEKALLIRET